MLHDKIIPSQQNLQLPHLVKFVTELLIFRSSRSQLFFKICVLKIFAILETLSKLQTFFYRTPTVVTVVASGFSQQKKLFSAEFGIYCRQMNRFLFRTPLKTRVKPQKQPLELFCQKKCSKKQPSRGVLRKGLLKIYSKFTGEHLYRSGISIKLQSNFIEFTLWCGCSPVNWRHIFRTAFPRNTPGWLLLVFLEILPISLKNTCIEVSF